MVKFGLHKLLAQSPDGLLHSDAVTATGILLYRGAPTGTSVTITGIAVGSPAVVTTSEAHGLTSGEEVLISGITGCVPPVSGGYTVTVIDTTHFSLLVDVTTLGTGGSVIPATNVIGELNELDPGGISRNKVETTTHNDGSSSYILGIIRQADPSLKINYLGNLASHAAILADIENNVANIWTIVYPSDIGRQGKAYVQAFKFDPVTPDAKQGASITLVWAGIVTEYVSGAGAAAAAA